MGADHAHRLAIGQPTLDVGDDVGAVLAAHQGREVDGAFRQQGVQLPRLTAGVDDGQYAVMAGDVVGDGGPVAAGIEVVGAPDLHPFQGGIQGVRVVDNFRYVIYTPQWLFSWTSIAAF